MKNILLILLSILILILLITGCESSNQVETLKDKKMNNTNNIILSYTTSSKIAILHDQNKIKQLEERLNETTFIKTDIPIDLPNLTVNYNSIIGRTSIHIDKNNVIQLSDGSCVTSNQIQFQELYSIFQQNTDSK